jgi:dTDP-4-amino-4,6-dideoxygalactose transaminase
MQYIKFLEEPTSEYYSNRWLTAITIEGDSVTREDVRMSLTASNIDCRPLWKPLHLQPVFEQTPYYGSNYSERLFEKGLCLPSGSNLTEDDLNRVVAQICQVIEMPKTVESFI